MHDFRASRTHQAGYAKHFTGMHTEIDILEGLALGEILHIEHFIADGYTLTLRVTLADFTTDHHTHDVVHVDVLDVLRTHICTVTQDGNAIAEFKDFFHSVGNIDDGNALFTQALDKLEQALGLTLGEGCGRLVHDEHLCVNHERLTDFHHLLLTDGQIGHHCIDRNIHAHLIHDLLRLLAHGLAVTDAKALCDLLAHEEILLHGQVIEHVQFLINKDNTGFFRFLRRLVDNLLAIHKNCAGVTGVHTG